MTAQLDPEGGAITEAVNRRPFSYFFWRRPLARALWTAVVVFWAGAGLSLVVDALKPVYDNAAAGLLYSILFPPLVCLYVLVGWLRQDIARGRIVLVPDAQQQSRSVSGFADPMSDPYDPRSPLYARRIHEMHRRRH